MFVWAFEPWDQDVGLKINYNHSLPGANQVHALNDLPNRVIKFS